MSNYLVIFLILTSAIWGSIYEGIRPQQYIFFIGFAMIAVFVMLEIYSVIVLGFFSLVMFLLIANNSIYGDANFSDLKMVGPYQVGHQDIHTSK